MEKHIITISREFGSGGRTIGKLVAEHLGIQCYDAELIQKLAVESGFDESYIKEAGEYTPGGFLASAFTDRSFGPTNSSLFQPLAAAVVVAVQVLYPRLLLQRNCHVKQKRQWTVCLPVDIPTGWEPQAKQQPTGLIAYGAARRRLVQVLLSAVTAKGKLPCKTKKTAIKSCLPCGAVKQSKSEPFPFDAASAASPKVTVCVPSL